MNWVAQTLADFGQQLGLDSFSLNTHGVAQLRLTSGSQLCVEPVQREHTEEILVYFTQPLGFDANRLRRKALEKAHYSNRRPYAVQVATHGEGQQAELIVLVRLPQQRFTPQTLGHAVDFLDRWLSELKNGR